jgi:hypothetical protein
MKVCFLCLLALSVIPTTGQEASRMEEMYPRWAKAQKYAAEGFEPLDCFAGQVRVRGKKVTREQFSVFLPDPSKKCCGPLVKSLRTDEHGHFLVEPMQEGEYFAEFEFKGVWYTENFAIINSYRRCDATHVVVDFSDANTAKLQSYVDINDSDEPCRQSEPQCYRK